jgi:hypothetical protein
MVQPSPKTQRGGMVRTAREPPTYERFVFSGEGVPALTSLSNENPAPFGKFRSPTTFFLMRWHPKTILVLNLGVAIMGALGRTT